MSQDAVERVLGRLLTDKWFRLRSDDSLETVTLQERYHLNTAELRMFPAIFPPWASRMLPGWDRGIAISFPRDRNPGPDASEYDPDVEYGSPAHPPGNPRLRWTLRLPL